MDHCFQTVVTSDLLAKDSKQCKDPNPVTYHSFPQAQRSKSSIETILIAECTKISKHEFNQHLAMLATECQIQRGLHQHRPELSTEEGRYWQTLCAEVNARLLYTH